ncbi:MAG: hypothetical protein IT426_13975 [Pirellulales bacterium]|nr:hypothetical protein [Pirellulales bacterium]
MGRISADGGAGGNGSIHGGGGGGGRIAIYYTDKSGFTGTITAYGGWGYQYGGAGTVFTKSPAQTYGNLLLDNNAHSGAKTVDFDTIRFDLIQSRNGANAWADQLVVDALIIGGPVVAYATASASALPPALTPAPSPITGEGSDLPTALTPGTSPIMDEKSETLGDPTAQALTPDPSPVMGEGIGAILPLPLHRVPATAGRARVAAPLSPFHATAGRAREAAPIISHPSPLTPLPSSLSTLPSPLSTILFHASSDRFAPPENAEADWLDLLAENLLERQKPYDR